MNKFKNLTPEQKLEIEIKVRTCNCCGKLMKPLFQGAVSTYTYDNDGCRRIFVCDEECKREWESKYVVEEYNGNKIYCIDGKYMPYLGCSYYFTNIDDCKKRMEMKNVAVVSKEMLNNMWSFGLK